MRNNRRPLRCLRTFLSLVVVILLLPFSAQPATETHPCLLFGPADIAGLAARLGSSHLPSDNLDSALEGCLRGQRADAAIAYVMAWVSHVETTGKYTDADPFRWNPDYPMIVDLQWPYMTIDEQNRSKTALLGTMEDEYNQALAGGAWFYDPTMINNWTFGFMTDYIDQRLLLPALMFPNDPRSPNARDQGINFLKWWLDKCPGAIDGQPGEMMDETLTSPNGYGLWDDIGMLPLAIMLARNTTFDPYAYAGSLWHNEGIYRTYVLSYAEGVKYINNYSKAGYIGAGSGEYDNISPYSNQELLQLAMVYNDPVLAWHYYANPSPLSRTEFSQDWLSLWNQTPADWGYGWVRLLFWGRVAPVSPQAAGWPLSRLFPGAGAAVMRKSWNKHDGLVWARAGYGGSHYQPCQGTVIYHADDHVILGNGGNQAYSSDSRMNNVLLVDGYGQISPYPDLPAQRQKYGSITQVDADTYILDASPAYADLAAKVTWTRRVHYDRATDILEIKDHVATADGKMHDLAFNWVTEATIADLNKMTLPAGYIMLARPNQALNFQVLRPVIDTEADAFNTLLATAAQTNAVDVVWTIGKNETALSNYVNSQAAAPASFGSSFLLCFNNIIHPAKNEKALIRIRHDQGVIKLTILNHFGRTVRTVFNGSEPGGMYSYAWDGKDDSGQGVGSGVYVLHAQSGSQVKTEKIVVIR